MKRKHKISIKMSADNAVLTDFLYDQPMRTRSMTGVCTSILHFGNLTKNNNNKEKGNKKER